MFGVWQDVILINLYWLSLSLIGYGGWRWMARSGVVGERYRLISRQVLKQHPLVQFFLSFTVAAIVLALVAMVCYLTHAPAAVFTAIYVLLFVAVMITTGLTAVMRLSRGWPVAVDRARKVRVRMVMPGPIVVLAVMATIALLTDFATALYSRAYAIDSADTYVHLSRIVEIIHTGFSIESGYFSGLAESGYHYNTLYALYVPPSQIFSLMPAEVWSYSLSFFRFVQWAALFTLALVAWGRWLRLPKHALALAYTTTIFAIVSLASEVLLLATYPNIVAGAWLIVLIAYLTYYESRPGRPLPPLLAIALLITTTHTGYGLMAAFFMIIVLGLSLARCGLRKSEVVKKIASYAAVCVVLMLGPLRTATLPNLNSSLAESIDRFMTFSVGPLEIKRPPDVLEYAPLTLALAVLGTAGLAYACYRVWSDRRYRPIVLALVLFFPLIVYVPPIFTILEQVLPHWVLARFASMNVLRLIAVPIGIFAVITAVRATLRRWPVIRVSYWSDSQAVTISLVASLVLAAGLALVIYPATVRYRSQSIQYYNFMYSTHDKFAGNLKGEDLVVANKGDSYLLGAILPIDVLAVEAGHMTPTADGISRIRCQERILQRFDYADLKEVGAHYVVLSAYSEGFTGQRDEANTKPYLKLTTGNESFLIYQFLLDVKENGNMAAQRPYQACLDFRRNEMQL